MTGNTVLLEQQEAGIALITLNRPEAMNAMNRAFHLDFARTLDTITHDTSTRVLVITGKGRAFCAGRDLKEYADAVPDPVQEWQGRVRSAFFATLTNCGLPVIAAVNGYCLAGGCELALACDIRIAGESAVFGLPEIDHGIWPGGGATYRLPSLIGTGRALEMMLTGMRIDARRAEQIGLVNRVVPDAQLMEESLAVAKVIAAKSASAVRLLRAAVRLGHSLDETNAVVATGALRSLTETTPERREGPRRFAERRQPPISR